MSKGMVIYRSRLQDFIVPDFKEKGKGGPVLNYYEHVRSFLNRSEFPNKEFLSQPQINKAENVIVWFSSILKDDACVSLADLPKESKKHYLNRLQECLEAWSYMVRSLKGQKNTNDKVLGTLLERLVSFVDERYVMCGGGEVVLVNWGIYPCERGDMSTVIYQDGLFLRDRNVEAPLDDGPDMNRDKPEDFDPDEDDLETLDDLNAFNEDEQGGFSIGIENSNLITDSSNLEFGSIHENLEDGELKPLINPVNTTDLECVATTTPELSHLAVEENGFVENGGYDKDISEEERVIEIAKGQTWFERIGKKLLSTILFLFLVGCLFWCMRNCSGDLPKLQDNVILPVDTAKIILDEDSVSYILSNQLVVFLERSDKKTVKAFTRAFKRLYPEENIRIVYYNESSGIIRLEVPQDRRIEIKEKLNSQLPEFSFLVMNEGVSQSNVTFNDPALRQANHNWYFRAIDAYSAWDVSTGKENIVVAVVDNGFDLNHPELKGKIVMPYNALFRNGNVFVSNGVSMAHGTHVAATAVGICDNGKGSLGVAPHCRLMPVQVADAFGRMPSTAIMEGVMYAINNGADVINLSIGSGIAPYVRYLSAGEQMNLSLNTGKAEEAAWAWITQRAIERNCVIVWAAGNDNIVAGVDPMKRNRHAIQVSAIDSTFTKADFSNYGWWGGMEYQYSTVSAPGVGIYNAAPNEKYVNLDGTSMAAPIVTGAVALLKSLDKSLTPDDIISVLQSTGVTARGSIGKVIQLGEALRSVSGKTIPPVSKIDCDSIARRAHELMKELKRLKQLCPDLTLEEDTLKFDDVINNPLSMNGLWKSTTPLYSSIKGEKIELYFNVRYPKGELWIIEENGKKYKAVLSLSAVKGNISITQWDEARETGTGDGSYCKYLYSCQSDKKDNLECTARLETNTNSKVVFNLVKIK